MAEYQCNAGNEEDEEDVSCAGEGCAGKCECKICCQSAYVHNKTDAGRNE